MPFTIAHTAAALPLRGTRLVISAVVIGSMAPDFEYFLRLAPQGRFGHSLTGLIVLTLPLALAALWLFHRMARVSLLRLAPAFLQQRLSSLAEFSFGDARRFGLIVVSALVGAVSHIVWDLFTHPQSWVVASLPFLRETLTISWLRPYPIMVCKILQHTSTVVGMAAITVWFVYWVRRTAPEHPIQQPLSAASKIRTVALLTGLAVLGGVIRAALLTLGRPSHTSFLVAFGAAIVTSIAVFWWELVALGAWWRSRESVPLPPVSLPNDADVVK